ncbi:hypothetical protein FDP41_011421 [Naegleria fowleri]|uniref:Methyltransferase domain-containing protein n=1 Tax=Naegleria fowleri TaxID=5763 RepID=A0A6A5C5X1_NAEFO|nr:uncharacterized protein FDP41_011421 [Naegleria fowleri]KAF0982491.1 hypothetical protein FDP41_011421 [Naegleria fowleri]CAG4715612.1 unnamed protein product [Naegleria fowleri]
MKRGLVKKLLSSSNISLFSEGAHIDQRLFSTWTRLNSANNTTSSKGQNQAIGVNQNSTPQEKLEKKLSKIERLFGKSSSRAKDSKKQIQSVSEKEVKQMMASPSSPNTSTSSPPPSNHQTPKNNPTYNPLSQFLDSRNLSDLSPDEIEKFKETLSPVKKRSTISSPVLGSKSIVEGEHDESALEKLKAPFYYKTILRLIEKQTYLTPEDRHSMKEYVKKEFKDRSKNVEEQYLIADNFVHIMRAKDLKSAKLALDISEESNVLEDSAELTYWNNYYQQHGFVDEWYCDWDLVKNFLPETIQKLKTAPTKETLKILDVGCGLSTVTLKLCDHFNKQRFSVTSIDISNVLIGLMKEQYADIPDVIGFSQVDVKDMEKFFEDNSFDIIFDKGTFDSIMSFDSSTIEDITAYESEIFRVLKPGGLFMLCSVTPLEGIEGFFSGEAWSSVKLAGKKNLLEDHNNKGRKLQLPQDSAIQDAHIYFYHIKKPSQ